MYIELAQSEMFGCGVPLLELFTRKRTSAVLFIEIFTPTAKVAIVESNLLLACLCVKENDVLGTDGYLTAFVAFDGDASVYNRR